MKLYVCDLLIIRRVCFWEFLLFQKIHFPLTRRPDPKIIYSVFQSISNNRIVLKPDVCDHLIIPRVCFSKYFNFQKN